MHRSFKKTIPLLFVIISSRSLSQPPASPLIPVIDNYFGMKVTDNYRWMENVNDSSFIKWLEQQDQYTEDLFTRISGREQLLNEYNKLDSLSIDLKWNLRKQGDMFLFLKRTSKDGKTFLMKSQMGKDEIIIDFNKEFEDKRMGVAVFEYSPVSKYIAFHIFENNHEGTTIYFYDLANHRFFPEQVKYSYGGYPYKTKFTGDGKGFFYYTLQVVNNKAFIENCNAKCHIIGSAPEKDKILASFEKYPQLFPEINKNTDFEVTTDPDAQYLTLLCGTGNGDYIFIANYKDLEKDSIHWQLLAKPDDKLDQPVIRNGIAYLLSKKVSNQQLLKCKLGDLKQMNFEIMIAADKYKLEGLSASKNYLFLNYSNGINNWVKQYDLLNGSLKEAAITEQGVYRLARISEKENEVEITITSWTYPSITYLYDPKSGHMKKSSTSNDIAYPGTADLTIKEIEIPSHDGVMIPLSIVYHKNTKLDGKAICILSGYGAYGSITSPRFSTDKIIYCKRGIIFAYAHVRGGGEKGESWRLAGFKSTKPNTWKDLISCAEWLIKNNYTNSSHLIAEGASAGGITVGRAVTERPELFAVVINRVGTTNILRVDQLPGLNTGEFGTVKDSAESRFLFEMDAVQHVKANTMYPAILCTAGMTDGRVPVWQPGKFAASLQHSTTSNKPVLLQVYFQGGHFGESGKNRNTNIVNEMAFALWQAGHSDFKLK